MLKHKHHQLLKKSTKMSNKNTALNEWFELKVQEFHQLGYDSITVDDFEEYAEYLRRKSRREENIPDLLIDVTPNQLFDYKLLRIQQTSSKKISDIHFDDIDN